MGTSKYKIFDLTIPNGCKNPIKYKEIDTLKKGKLVKGKIRYRCFHKLGNNDE